MRKLLKTILRISAGGALLAAVLFLSAAVFAVNKSQSGKPRAFTILYTSQVRGQIRACNCTKFRYGGYGRQATFVHKERAENKNVLLLEGGDFAGEANDDQQKLKNDVAAKAIEVIKYDAVTPGEGELVWSPKSVGDMEASGKTPVVLSNAYDRSTGKPATAKRYVVRKLPNGLRVGIIGLFEPGLLPQPPITEVTVRVSDPAAALKELLPKVRKQSDFVIVVAHATVEKAREFAQVRGVDLVLRTHTPKKPALISKEENPVTVPVEKIGETLFVESETQMGWSIGQLDLEIAGGKVKKYTNRLHYLDRNYEESPEMLKVYDEYNEQVRRLGVQMKQDLRAQLEELRKLRGIDLSKRVTKTYLGTEDCKACHSDVYSSWENSRHATAMKSLEKTNQEYDPECVGCHSTGWQKQGGFTNVKETPKLAGVGCEACHGPGRSHKEKPEAGFGPAGEETCGRCHTQEIDPEFNYETYWAKVKH